MTKGRESHIKDQEWPAEKVIHEVTKCHYFVQMDSRKKKKPSTLFDEKMLLHFKILTVINFRWQFLHTVLNSSIKVLIYLVLTLFRYLPEMILLACNIYFDKRYSWVLVRHLPTNSKYFDFTLLTYLRFFSVAYLIYFFKNLVLKYDFW